VGKNDVERCRRFEQQSLSDVEKSNLKRFEEAILKEWIDCDKAEIVRKYARNLYYLRNVVENLNLWGCPECGNFSLKGCICSACGFDPS